MKRIMSDFNEKHTADICQYSLNRMMPFYLVDKDDFCNSKNHSRVNLATAYYIRQSLERDDYRDCYAFVENHGESARIILTCSDNTDLSKFEQQLVNFYNYGFDAVCQFDILSKDALLKNKTSVQELDRITFSLELGLTLVNHNSLMLLHYPPNSTKDFSDFLYAPTISRWSCLLAQCGVKNEDIIKKQRIVNVLPLVADSLAGSTKREDGSTILSPFERKKEWHSYIDRSIEQFLSIQLHKEAPPSQTFPTVVFGFEAKAYIWDKYRSQVIEQVIPVPSSPADIKNNTVISLVGVLSPPFEKVVCPVLFAPHPSAFLYNTDVPFQNRNNIDSWGTPFSKVQSGLICAEWVNLMSEAANQALQLATDRVLTGSFHNSFTNGEPLNSVQALKQAMHKWSATDVIDQILIQQAVQFWPCNENRIQDVYHNSIIKETESYRKRVGVDDIDGWVSDSELTITQEELNIMFEKYKKGFDPNKNVRRAAQVAVMKIVNRMSFSGFATFLPTDEEGKFKLKFTNPFNWSEESHDNQTIVTYWRHMCSPNGKLKVKLQYWDRQRGLEGSVFEYVLPPIE